MRKKKSGFRRRPAAGQYRPDFRRYEAEKNAWIVHHPKATGEEYIEAMREIAQRCGI
jgi:hypothetical protein